RGLHRPLLRPGANQQNGRRSLMAWLADAWTDFVDWLPWLIALLDVVVIVGTITWVLMIKSNATSAVAWCLLIIFLPFVGAILFFLFGYKHVSRPLRRKRRHKQKYQLPPYPTDSASDVRSSIRGAAAAAEVPLNDSLSLLANRFGAYPLTLKNQVDFYHEGQ